MPRFIQAGDVLMTTTRVLERRFLLRPDRRLTQAARYIIACYASKYGIELHSVCVMSTHLHMVFTDPRGVCPNFLRDVHRGLANVVKARWRRKGEVFCRHPSVVRLTTPQSIANEIGYVQANPVAAGAVKYIRDWPGLVTHTGHMGAEAQVISRTDLYFRPNGCMPDEATLRFVLPRALVEHYGPRGARDVVAAATRKHADDARKEIARRGWKFAGRDRCMRVSPFKTATAYEVWGKLNPTFATKGGGAAAYLEVVRLLRAFRQAYRLAMLAWKRGDRSVEFPHGTWAMRVLHGAPCAPPPA